jgi:hypothetical protein
MKFLKNIKVKLVLVAVTVGFLLSSCGEEKEECAFIPETSGTSVDLKFESLSHKLVDISKDQLYALLDNHRVLRDNFFRRDLYPSDSAFVNELTGDSIIRTLIRYTWK